MELFDASALANGPLGWSIPTQANALVLHSVEHMVGWGCHAWVSRMSVTHGVTHGDERWLRIAHYIHSLPFYMCPSFQTRRAGKNKKLAFIKKKLL